MALWKEPSRDLAVGQVEPKAIHLGLMQHSQDRTRYDEFSYKGPSHLITVAPARSGKFRDVLAKATMLFSGSVIYVDPKGQAACVTARGRKARGSRIVVLNGFNIHSDRLGPSASYNPMDNLDPKNDSFGADADNLADGIVTRENGGNAEHFSLSARTLSSGVIRGVAKYYPSAQRNLLTVRSIIANGSELKEFCRNMCDTGDPVVADKLARFAYAEPDDREVKSVIATAITQTDFLDNAAIARTLRTSSFRFAELREQRTTVYIVLPMKYLGSCSKWFRLMVAGALEELLVEERRGPVPVLAILDEFAQLGHLSSIENAMSMAAGYGLQLWPILQNLGQLKEHYGNGWQTFLSGAGVRQFFAPRDLETAEYISNLCGPSTVRSTSQSRGEISMQQVMSGFSGINTSVSETQRPLIFPNEVMKIPDHAQMLFIERVRNPVLAYRAGYYMFGNIAGYFDPDPERVSLPARQ